MTNIIKKHAFNFALTGSSYQLYGPVLREPNIKEKTTRIAGFKALTAQWLMSCRTSCTVQISNLQVVGQFRSSSIARVHCDTDVTHWIQNQLGAFKLKRLHTGLHRTNYAQNLKICTKTARCITLTMHGFVHK